MSKHLNENYKNEYENEYAARWFIDDSYSTGEIVKSNDGNETYDKGILLACFERMVVSTFTNWKYVCQLVENEEELFNVIADNAYDYFKNNDNDVWRYFCEDTGYDWYMFDVLDNEFKNIINEIINDFRISLKAT